MSVDTIKLNDGGSIPAIGLGTSRLTGQQAVESVGQAIKAGYRLIDTAEMYGNEAEVGQAINDSEVKRAEIFINTKISPRPGPQTYQSIKDRCHQMATDYVDMCLIHWPPAGGDGEDMWPELVKAKADGLAKHIGVSNYTIEQLKKLQKLGELPSVNQIEASPFGFDQQLIDDCQALGVVVQAYSPLTRTGRLGDANLAEIAKSYNKSPAQILLRWSRQKGLLPLPKATSEAHLKDNLEVFDFELTQADMVKLDGLNEGYTFRQS
ncbi:MAG TPA: aldo/keto reductase [Candidatus Saccharimonadales bacterium]